MKKPIKPKSRKSKSKKSYDPNRVLKHGGMTDEQIKRGRLANAAKDQQFALHITQAVTSAGGEVLRDEFEFSQEQLNKWLELTVKKARGYLADGVKKKHDD